MAKPQPILEIRDLVTRFATRYGVVTAVDGVSLTVSPLETDSASFSRSA